MLLVCCSMSSSRVLWAFRQYGRVQDGGGVSGYCCDECLSEIPIPEIRHQPQFVRSGSSRRPHVQEGKGQPWLRYHSNVLNQGPAARFLFLLLAIICHGHTIPSPKQATSEATATSPNGRTIGAKEGPAYAAPPVLT